MLYICQICHLTSEHYEKELSKRGYHTCYLCTVLDWIKTHTQTFTLTTNFNFTTEISVQYAFLFVILDKISYKKKASLTQVKTLVNLLSLYGHIVTILDILQRK